MLNKHLLILSGGFYEVWKKAFLLLAFTTFVFTGCLDALFGPSDEEDSTTDEKIAKLAYVQWAEGVAYTHVAEVVLEQELGYDCQITAVDVADGFKAVADGTQDAFMEVWPNIHGDYIDEYSADISDLGIIYDGAISGLAVPQYVYDAGLQSISDLTNSSYVNNLNGEIQGIDSGSGLMQTMENKVMPDDGYGLDSANYTLLADDGPTMISALDTAVSNDNWIVVTIWRPHWAFGKYNIKFLDDPQNVWSEGSIHIYGRAGLGTDNAELKTFLSNMYFTNAQLSDLMLQFKESTDSNEVTAQEWVNNNSSVVQSWLPE